MIRLARWLWDHVWYRWEDPHPNWFSKSFYIGMVPPYHRGNGYRISTRRGALAFGFCKDHPQVTPEEQLGGRQITVEEWNEMKRGFSRADAEALLIMDAEAQDVDSA